MPVADLLQRHAAAWERATAHPFLLAVRDGTLPEPAFDAWLVQDHRFVAELLRFQARLLARAPRPAQAVLAGGLVALVEELTWFEQVAAARGLALGAAPRPATEDYARLLDRLDTAPVAVATAALWAVERAYLDAWATAAPGAPAYREFVAHWTAPGFAGYVAALAGAADEVGAAADGGVAADVDAAVAQVAAVEAAFWSTAWPGDAA